MKAAYLREEIEIPKGVTITLDGMKVRVKGPKGEIEKDFVHIKGIQMSLSDNKLILETTFADRRKKAQFYTIIAHIKNAITGVTTGGFRYYLKVIFTHFPISVKVAGNEVQISNLIGDSSFVLYSRSQAFPRTNHIKLFRHSDHPPFRELQTRQTLLSVWSLQLSLYPLP